MLMSQTQNKSAISNFFRDKEVKSKIVEKKGIKKEIRNKKKKVMIFKNIPLNILNQWLLNLFFAQNIISIMSTHIAWFSSQNSYNFVEPHQDSSQVFVRINQNSISFFGRHSSFPRQQQSKSIFNIQAVIESYVSKGDSLFNRQEILSFQILNGFNSAPNPSDSLPESESQIQQTSKEMEELGSKKGLKNLAKLLIRILKKKKFDSSKYLTEEIEQKLMKGKKISKNVLILFNNKEHIRESKNIRRRTYDALNVMIAANVLGPDLTFIRRVNSQSFTKKCALIIGQKNQFETKITTAKERINKKKLFLEQLQNKKESLQWWIEQKQMEENKTSTQQQSQNNKLDKKSNNSKGKIKNKRIPLPVVVIADNESDDSKKISMSKQGVVKVNCQNSKVKIFSDIDCFSILKHQSEMDQEPSETFEDDENAMKTADKKPIVEEGVKNQEDIFATFSWNQK